MKQPEILKKKLVNFLLTLAENQLLHIKLPCLAAPGQESAFSLYINYLHLGKLIVVPQFGLKEDAKALSIIKEVMG